MTTIGDIFDIPTQVHQGDFVRALHPQAPTPGFYQAERLFDDARRLRVTMGDAAFFATLGSNQAEGSGWGNIETSWDAESFNAAMAAALALMEQPGERCDL